MEFNTTLISKYRNVLMGIGIIDVLLWHLANCYQLQGISSQIIGTLTRTVFTPGFLFLSGFGIYYSYSNHPNKKEFYKRRVCRLLLPFWAIVSVIFLLRLLLTGVGDITYYLGMITTASFWIPNMSFNYWYIAVILLFYLLYPFLHNYLFGSELKPNNETTVYVNTIVICTLLVLVNILLYYQYPFYNEIELAIPKLPMLVIGAFVGYLSKNKNFKFNLVRYLIGGLAIICILFYLKSSNPICEQYYYIIDKLVTIPILITFFEFLQRKYKRAYGYILSVLGWFGSYTLELYVIHIYLLRVVSDFQGLPQWSQWWISVPISLIICVPVNNITKKFRYNSK